MTKDKGLQHWLVPVMVVLLGVIILLILPVKIPSSGKARYASQGQLIPGFPAPLVLDSAAQITKSYTVTYPSGVTQYTTFWNSAAAPDGLLTGYLIYFSKNGWQAEVQGNTQFSKAVYAENGSAAVNLGITPSGTGSAVTLNYVVGMKLDPIQPGTTIYQGALMQNFPDKYIIDPSGTVLNSSDAPDFNLKTRKMEVVYQSDDLPAAMYEKYNALFSGKEWLIRNESQTSTPETILAVNGSLGEVVSVFIMPGRLGQSGSVMTVSVQTKMQ